MVFNIQLADEFLDEIEDICGYISDYLKVPIASKKLREKTMYNILLLEKSPKIFPEMEKFDRVKRKYRRIVVNNFIVLYTIDEQNKKIYIAHIYYGGANYI